MWAVIIYSILGAGRVHERLAPGSRTVIEGNMIECTIISGDGLHYINLNIDP